MKKVLLSELLLVLLLLLTIGVLLYRRDPDEHVTQKDILELIEQMNQGEMKEAGPLSIKRVFSLEKADYEYMIYFEPAESMDVREFFFVKGDKNAVEEAEKAMKERLSSLMTAFDHYGELQMERLNKAVIYKNKNYAFYLTSDDPDAWMRKINKVLGVSYGIQ